MQLYQFIFGINKVILSFLADISLKIAKNVKVIIIIVHPHTLSLLFIKNKK